MKRSETVGNSRKRSETWSGQNLFNPHFFLNKHFRATPFFFWMSKGVQGETVGNSRRSHLRSAKKTCCYTIFKHVSWTYATKQLLFCRAKVRSPTVSNRFPWDTFGHSKKNGIARKCLFKNQCGLNKFWPDHVSDRFRPFPTVSDRFRPFHFFWTINWTTSIYGRLIQRKPVQTMTLKFFGATLVRVHCTKYCILTWYPIIPKNHKIPGAREI